MDWVVFRIARLEYIKMARRRLLRLAIVLPLFFYLLAHLFMGGLLLTNLLSGEQRLPQSFLFDLPRPLEDQPIGLVDRGGSLPPDALPPPGPIVYFDSEQEARQALLDGELRLLFVLSEDYLAMGHVIPYLPERAQIDRKLIEEDAAQLEAFLASRFMEQIGATGMRFDLWPVRWATESRAAGQLEAVQQQRVERFGIGYIFFILMTISASFLLHSISEEKESRVIEIVLSSVSPTELMAGKLVGLVALAVSQAVLWGGAAFLLTDRAHTLLEGLMAEGGVIQVALFLFVWLLGCFLYGALALVGGSLGVNKRDSQQMMGTILWVIPVLPVLMAMLGTFYPAALEGSAVRFLTFFPLTAPPMLLFRLLLGTVDGGTLLAALAVMLLTLVTLLWLGGKLFRLGVLTLGKRPTRHQMWQVLTEGGRL